MSRPLSLLTVAVLLVAGACADEEPAPSLDAPQTVATTTVAPVTIAPSTGAGTATSTTAPAAASSSTSTTTTSTTTTLPLAELELQLVEIATGFEQPVLALAPPGDDKLYIVDQPGRIWVLAGGSPQLFVDLRDDVIFGGERGLLGLAFHPDFATNRRLFVNYIGGAGSTRVAELEASADGLTATAADPAVILEIPQPARNHNGGMIAFGPDGYLYVGMGDGGGANDQFGQGQRPESLLAALLRIDVTEPGTYEVPSDNPFSGGDGGAPEVFAYGLRNPWRFAFDGSDLFIADVGQRQVEEINGVSVDAARGANFGWPLYEGSDCFSGPCDDSGLVQPVYEYNHNEGCSITGGFVYRGSQIPELSGHYFFADYCEGWIRSLSPAGDVTEWFDSGGRRVTSFGVDGAGELYVTVQAGSVFRIERA